MHSLSLWLHLLLIHNVPLPALHFLFFELSRVYHYYVQFLMHLQHVGKYGFFDLCRCKKFLNLMGLLIHKHSIRFFRIQLLKIENVSLFNKYLDFFFDKEKKKNCANYIENILHFYVISFIIIFARKIG